MDRAWWDVYGDEVTNMCQGLRLTVASGVKSATTVKRSLGKNSGAGAILLAAHFGASSVVLLGYDVQCTDGMAHWHADHPKGLGNAGALKHWPAQFRDVATTMAGTPVVNCSRQTSLTVFPRLALPEALSKQPEN